MASTSADFTGKVFIVTGASSGLGQATALLLAERGALVALCGRNQEKLTASLDACAKASGGHADRFTSISGDITDSAHRLEIVDKTVKAFGRLDVLVANAGLGLPGGSLIEATEQTFDEIFNTNVKAGFFLIQAALPHLEKTNGNVVNVSSILSAMPSGNSALYPMSKAAVDHMTRCLAFELAPKGIRINAVNPSFFPSGIVRHFGDDVDQITKHALAAESKNQPLRGECISAQDVANLIVFLASDAARTITGQCHVIDGGRTFMGQ